MGKGILFVTNSGEILPIAYRMRQEGAACEVYIHHPSYHHGYEGLLNRVKLPDLKRAFQKSDMVVFDITRPNKRDKWDLAMLGMFGLKGNNRSVFGPVADVMKKTHPVIGGAEWCEDIELDRALGFEIAQKMGLKIPEWKEFSSFKDGEKFLDGQKDMWILKPQFNEGFTHKEEWAGELLAKIKEWKAKGKKEFAFILQKLVAGVEISTEAWFDGVNFRTFNHTAEEKLWMTGGLGCAIGCQNTVVWMKEDENGLLCNEIRKIEPYLRSCKYVGPVDLNVIVDNQTMWFLEFTPRFGYDALYGLLTLLDGPVSNFFYSGFRGKWKKGYAAAARITIPPFPYQDDKLLKELAAGVRIENEINRTPWCWFEDVRQGADCLEVVGADGIVGVVTAHGKTIEESANECYSRIKRLKIAGKLQYRTDLGKRAVRAMTRLQGWGHVIR